MSAEPYVVVLNGASLAALAGVSADRCGVIARHLEMGSAIDQSLLAYAHDLNAGAEALVDQLPADAVGTLGKSVSRLANALELRNRAKAA